QASANWWSLLGPLPLWSSHSLVRRERRPAWFTLPADLGGTSTDLLDGWAPTVSRPTISIAMRLPIASIRRLSIRAVMRNRNTGPPRFSKMDERFHGARGCLSFATRPVGPAPLLGRAAIIPRAKQIFRSLE